ncbi:MAG: hypothetical protein ACYDBB_04780 [Armatimonadota bacterium]
MEQLNCLSLNEAIRCLSHAEQDTSDGLPSQLQSQRTSDIRHAGAYALYRLAHQRRRPFPAFILQAIYAVMSDENPAVRLSLAAALFYAGGNDSIAYLHQLIAAETDRIATVTDELQRSELFKIVRFAEVAIARCRRFDIISSEAYHQPIVAVVTEDIELVSALSDVLHRYDAHIVLTYDAADLLAFPIMVYIVDLQCIKEADWRYVCNQIADDAREGYLHNNTMILLHREPRNISPSHLPIVAADTLAVLSPKWRNTITATLEEALTMIVAER